MAITTPAVISMIVVVDSCLVTVAIVPTPEFVVVTSIGYK